MLPELVAPIELPLVIQVALGEFVVHATASHAPKDSLLIVKVGVTVVFLLVLGDSRIGVYPLVLRTVIEIERRYGKKLNDVVSEKFDSEKLQRTLPKINVRKTEKIEEGSILEFYGKRDNRLHVAVSLGGNIFIQSTENQGVRISSLESAGQYLTLKNIYEVI